jgi:hypothetical protein
MPHEAAIDHTNCYRMFILVSKLFWQVPDLPPHLCDTAVGVRTGHTLLSTGFRPLNAAVPFDAVADAKAQV